MVNEFFTLPGRFPIADNSCYFSQIIDIDMLSKKAQYALYALRHLALEYGKGPVLISKISEDENIPKKFLEAILLELKNKAIVSSKMGKGGGYYLLKKPNEVSLIDIIRGFDGPVALLPCASELYYEECTNCPDESKCGFKPVLKEVRDKTVEILSRNTLANIIKKEYLIKKT